MSDLADFVFELDLSRPVLRLVPIDRSGVPAGAGDLRLDRTAEAVCAASAAHYERAGFAPPWIGYLAVSGSMAAGACGFKGAPVDGAVEIAYFTFPAFERRGLATAMARTLLEIAHRAEADLDVTAQTLPVESPSTRVLTRLGFVRQRTIDHPEDGPVWEWLRREGAGGL
jgi:RimJ/RimL family protein N-acetyltransferase